MVTPCTLEEVLARHIAFTFRAFVLIVTEN